MKAKFSLFILPFFILLFIGCIFQNRINPSKEIIEFKVSASDFNAIDASGIYNIQVKQGTEESVIIKCNSNLKEYLNTYQKGNTIHLEMENIWAESDVVIDAIITVKDLNSIECSGATTLLLEPAKYENLEFDLSGACNIKAPKLKANNLSIDASGD